MKNLKDESVFTEKDQKRSKNIESRKKRIFRNSVYRG